MKTEAGTLVTVLCASTKTAGAPPEPGEGLEPMLRHAFRGKQPCRRLDLPPRPVCARCYSSPRALIPQQDKAEGHGADDTFHKMQQHSHNSFPLLTKPGGRLPPLLPPSSMQGALARTDPQ